jgi:hypothetical protein
MWQVRISRKRILESAAKVFEMYGASRAVLEIEYFGEVGTGLGPTLEFYTMLSHDLQRKGLGMWRGDDSAASKVATGARHLTIETYRRLSLKRLLGALLWHHGLSLSGSV